MTDTFEAQSISVVPNNVVSLWSRLSSSNREHLSRWIKAGRALGLIDFETIYARGGPDRGNVQVLIWVREAADPAYRVDPNGYGWTVSDNLRGNELSRHPTFELALEAIRPVFSFNVSPRKRGGGRVSQRSKAMLTTLGSWTAAVRL
jgi:hypothetical protein